MIASYMSKVIVVDHTKELVLKLKKVTEVGLLKATLLVEGTAIDKVPVDTGRLRSSITHRVEPDFAEVGTNVEYAPNVEFGIDQKPQPYLRPALDENRSNIINIMEQSVKELEK